MLMSLFISFAMLAMAGFANAASISGYNAFKDTVRETLNLSNATITMSMQMSVDGIVEQYESSLSQFDIERGILYEGSSSYRYSYYNFIADTTGNFSEIVNLSIASDGEISSWNYSNSHPQSTFFDVSPEMIRVIEILGDALSGNAKDYFFVTDQNGVRTITAQLKKAQVPEIVSAAIALMNSTYSYYRHDEPYVPDPDFTPYEALTEKLYCGFIKQIDVTDINMLMETDKNYNYVNGNLEAIILFTDNNNETNEMKVVVDFNATDIGKTVIAVPEDVREHLKDNYPGLKFAF